MKKVISVLICILIIVGIIRIVYEHNTKKEERVAKERFELRQQEVKQKGAPAVQIFNDTGEMEKIFYPNLATCSRVNLATEDNVNYVIYGMDKDKCVFEKFSQAYCLHCETPVKVTKKYSQSGLQAAGTYINEINNNPEYCKISIDNLEKPKKKDKKTSGNKAKKQHIKHNSNKIRR